MRCAFTLLLTACAIDDRALWEPDVVPSRIAVVEYDLYPEQARLDRHFDVVAAELARASVGDLSPMRAAARGASLAELRRYRARRTYPRNYSSPQPIPIFIDPHGTRCAMADLIEHAGGGELVARVAAAANTARIEDLAGDRDLIAWLDGNGLTVAEAARIQPTYVHRNVCIEAAVFDLHPEVAGLQPSIHASILDASDPDAVVERELHRCGEQPADFCYLFERDPNQCPNADHWMLAGPYHADFPGRFRGEILVEAD